MIMNVRNILLHENANMKIKRDIRLQLLTTKI